LGRSVEPSASSDNSVFPVLTIREHCLPAFVTPAQRCPPDLLDDVDCALEEIERSDLLLGLVAEEREIADLAGEDEDTELVLVWGLGGSN
jgi:hypothetical protein